jgi:hypothetical protein
MTPLRDYLRDRRHFAMAIVLLALLMRLLLPTGFMPEVSAGKITIALCTGHGPAAIEMAMPSSGGHHDQGQTAKHDMPCPFSSGSTHGLAGADPILPAIAIAFVMALSLRPVAIVRIGDAPYLRPPLRGPPLAA